MDDAQIERRLRLPIATLCFAVIGTSSPEDLREAKNSILREVARIVHDATNPHIKRAPGE